MLLMWCGGDSFYDNFFFIDFKRFLIIVYDNYWMKLWWDIIDMIIILSLISGEYIFFLIVVCG